MVKQVKESQNTPLLSVLLDGSSGVGKTALAAWIAKNSFLPFIKLISPENYIGFSEAAKVQAINKLFDDAYKSPFSLIVLDNLERLIEYVKLGPRFSNIILQALIILIKKQPPKENRQLLIIGTCGDSQMLEQLELTSAFQQTVYVPQLDQKEMNFVIQQKFKCQENVSQSIVERLEPMGIKQLLLGLERARQEGGGKIEDVIDCFPFELVKN